MHILIVEDEEKIAGFLSKGLEKAGYTADVTTNGEDALARTLTCDYAAIVLDIMLPGKNGLIVVRELRKRGDAIPILALTARNTLADRVRGLDNGCDDYLAKPFAFEELLARLRALLRRHKNAGSPRLEYAGLVLDPVTRYVARDGQPLELTYKEYSLLELLLRHPGQVLTRGAIMENVWGEDPDANSNVLDVYMNFLRKKVERDSSRRLLHTVRGVGYALREGQP